MDYLVPCPYNYAHHVYYSRLQIHVIKCSKRSLIEMDICPYEATHHVRVEEYEYHLRHCPNNKMFKGSFLDFRNEMQYKNWCNGKFNIVRQFGSREEDPLEENWDNTVDQFNNVYQFGSREEDPLEENWDNTVDQVGTYNAEEMSKRKKVLRTTSLRSKNERKWFRYQERKRYAALEMQELQNKLEETHLDEPNNSDSVSRHMV